MIIYIIYIIIVSVLGLLVVAFYILAERKVIAAVQRRRGPNVVGIWGFLQPFADAVKLLGKELIIPAKANKVIYLLSPVIALTIALSQWLFLPINFYPIETFASDFNVTILLWFCLSSFGVYAIIIAGWSSNSKYAFLGSIRSSAQIISYEVFFSLILLTIVMLSGSINLGDIIIAQENIWFIVPCLPLAVSFFIAGLAETNRTPFDLTEAEAEIVAGYNVEYSSIAFAIFFLAEYANIFSMSIIIVTFFFGGGTLYKDTWIHLPNSFIFSAKAVLLSWLIIHVRSNLPRYRYDQLIGIGWKVFLPFTFAWFIISLICVSFAAEVFYFLEHLHSNLEFRNAILGRPLTSDVFVETPVEVPLQTVVDSTLNENKTTTMAEFRRVQLAIFIASIVLW